MTALTLLPVEGIPEIGEGDDLGSLIAERAAIEDGDVLVVAQKVVSKSEGRVRQLGEVTPSEVAVTIAEGTDRDPRMVQVVLDESVRIVRRERVLIVETHQGFVCANGGVDQSNVPGEDTVLLLPIDADRSAAIIRERVRELTGRQVAVIVSDTFGRPWRTGIVNVALGVAGLAPLADLRGSVDDQGRELHATIIAVADELASAAELVSGKTRRVPVVIVRGHVDEGPAGTGRELIRDAEHDLFR